jgi:hypothetical protein
VSADGTSYLDPFYDSWLPYGPLPGDANNIDDWFQTDLCGPTSQSVAYMAAISAKSASTQVKPNSWTDLSFLNAAAPASQKALPAPLYTDHNTLGAQMTAQEIQRVINMAILQGTDPTEGGQASRFTMQAMLDFTSSNGQPAASIDHGNTINAATLANLVHNGYATVIVIGWYIASWVTNVAPSPFGGRGQRTISFTRNGGHVLAVNGYTNASNPVFAIYDPIYARILSRSLVPLPATYDSEMLSITGKLPTSLASIIHYDDEPVVTTLADVQDGQMVAIIDEYDALKLQ